MRTGVEEADVRKMTWEHLPYVIVVLLGLLLLLVGNTAGAGDFRWRFVLYFGLTLLLAGTIFAFYARRRMVHFDRGFLAAAAVMAALLALAALSLIWGESSYRGMQQLLLLGSFVMAFILGYLVLRNRGELWLFMGLLTAVSVSLCVYGLMQYFFFFGDLVEFLGRHGIDYVITDRVNSRFITPNVFAAFLNITIPVAVALLLAEKRRALTFVWGGALALQLACLYLTQSRGGWLVCAAVILLLAIIVPGSKWKIRWKILAAAAVLAVLAAYLCSLYSPLGAATDAGAGGEYGSGREYSGLDVTEAAGSMRGRFGIWRGGLDMLSHNLVGGVGSGGFGLAMQRYQYRAYYSSHAHDYLLETGAETGVAGLLLMAVLSIMVLYRIRYIFRKEPWEDARVMAAALWTASAGFLVHNLIDIPWYSPLVGVAFWLCVGALFALSGRMKTWQHETAANETAAGECGGGERLEPAPSTGPRERGVAGVTVLVGVALALLVVAAGYVCTVGFLSETHKETAEEQMSLRDAEGAIAGYERALSCREADPEAHHQLGYLYLNLMSGEADEARKGEYGARSSFHLGRAIELEPEDAYHHLWKGILLLSLGDHEGGRSSLHEAQRLYPNNPIAFYYEGESLLDEGDYEGAVTAYEKAIALLPFYADQSIVPFRDRPEFDFIRISVCRVADIRLEQGRPDEALGTIDAALAIVPDNAALHFQRAVVLEQMGEWEKALAELEMVLELNPWAGGVHLEMGIIYKEIGDPQMAEEMFRMELERNPHNEKAREELESLTGGE
ncbi:MAG: tetratricopeptide repeat protein [Actinobacteria bacterium]|jgi:putative inorganic carbon (HCO3(-)) transporter|nr:MAG: tetratricopeptide repeat protein [Actinomycetota bacterium]